MFARICGIALAGGLFTACSGGATQQNALPQPAPVKDPAAPRAQPTASPAPKTPAPAQTTAPPAQSTAPPAHKTPTPAPTTTSPAQSTPPPSSTLARFSRITVVIAENYNYSQLIGNNAAPLLNSLAQSNALFTNSHGVTHPSEPNYLALFSGSTQGLKSDACPVTFSGANLATELTAKGYSFAGYAEDWPGSGTCAASGNLYRRKHVPWVSFSNVPLGDAHSYGGPATPLTGSVNFVVPNMCDDGHDCSIATLDAWLTRNIPPIQNYDDAHNGLLIVTFDEGDNSSNNHIVTIVSGPRVVRGSYSQSIDHYAVLRLIEINFGLPLLGASATAASMPVY